MKASIKPIAFALLAAFAAAQAQAATLSNDAFSISYSDQLTQFGTPSLIGNTLVFNPTALKATAFGGAFDLNTATFSFTVSANTGYQINGLNLFESGGSYQSGNAFAKATGQLIVSTIGNAPQIHSTSFSALAGDGVSTWTGNASINPSSALSSASITLNNYLVAGSTGLGSFATINKGNTQIGFSVAAVPEPESYAMFLAGLGIVGAVARRRRKYSQG